METSPATASKAAGLDHLVSDYCHGGDKHDSDRFMSIWHDDAVLLDADGTPNVEA